MSYYTPQLKELFVGFLLEELHAKMGFPNTWVPVEADGNIIRDCQQMVVAGNIHKVIRVKHLDREDIESKGWEFYGTEDLPEFRLTSGPFTWILIWDQFGGGMVEIMQMQEDESSVLCHYSSCLNLSKLSVIMEDIGI